MGQLDTGPALKEYSPQVIYKLMQDIEQAINYLSETNFPNTIDGGSVFKTGTLPGAALKDFDVTLKKLKWGEFIVFTASAIPVFSTTSTAGVNIGPYFAWDLAKFPGGSWFIEASMCIANAAATATLTLKGVSDIGSITTQETSLIRARSTALTMPTSAQNIWFNLKTNNASYAASIAGAHLIYVP